MFVYNSVCTSNGNAEGLDGITSKKQNNTKQKVEEIKAKPSQAKKIKAKPKKKITKKKSLKKRERKSKKARLPVPKMRQLIASSDEEGIIYIINEQCFNYCGLW